MVVPTVLATRARRSCALCSTSDSEEIELSMLATAIFLPFGSLFAGCPVFVLRYFRDGLSHHCYDDGSTPLLPGAVAINDKKAARSSGSETRNRSHSVPTRISAKMPIGSSWKWSHALPRR